MRSTLVSLLVVAVAVAACNGDAALPSGSRGDAIDRRPYAVLVADAWPLQEAVDLADDSPFNAVERPPLEWFAEYVAGSPNGSSMIRLSGHLATFADTRSALQELGFTFGEIPLQHWNGVGGSAPADPASPTIIVLDNASTTLMLLSYELELDQLTTIADKVEGVDQSAWITMGGVIQ